MRSQCWGGMTDWDLSQWCNFNTSRTHALVIAYSTPEYIPCCQNCHSYHLAQTVGHCPGSWRTRHSCTAGSILYSHQTQLRSRAMPFLWRSLHRTISFWTLYHLSYTLCQLWVYCRIINQREHWYFCTCQAFSASCILLTLASSLLFCY